MVGKDFNTITVIGLNKVCHQGKVDSYTDSGNPPYFKKDPKH